MDYAEIIWYKWNLARYASCRSNDSGYRIYDESYEASCAIKYGRRERSDMIKNPLKQLRGFSYSFKLIAKDPSVS